MLHSFFWVILRFLNFICRRFGTRCLFNLHSHSSHLRAYEDGTDRVFRNVGILNSDAVELPRRKHTTEKTFIHISHCKVTILSKLSPTCFQKFFSWTKANFVSCLANAVPASFIFFGIFSHLQVFILCWLEVKGID